MPVFKVNLKYATLSEVTDGLFVCGISELKPDILWKLGITCIINCTSEVPNLTASTAYDFERIKLWLNDDDDVDLLEHFDDVSDKINEVKNNGGKTLLHCLAGVSRSAAFALAYLIKYENLTLRRAYAHCALKRPLVRPNLGFWRQLIHYEQILRGDRPPSVRMVAVDVSEKADGSAHQLVPDVYLDAPRVFNAKIAPLPSAMMLDDDTTALSSPSIGRIFGSSIDDRPIGQKDDGGKLVDTQPTASLPSASSSKNDSVALGGAMVDDLGGLSALKALSGAIVATPDMSAMLARIMRVSGLDDDNESLTSSGGSVSSRRSSARRFTPRLESLPESDLDEYLI